jgi:PAS domain S-box-containing protein
LQVVTQSNPQRPDYADPSGEYLNLAAENAQLKRELDNITRQLPHLRQLIEYAADALILHDDQGMIVDCNQRCAEMFALPREDLYEQNLSHFLGNLTHIMLERVGQLSVGVREKFIGTLLRDDHTSIPVEIHITAFQTGGSRLHVSSLRDISDRLKSENALRETQTKLSHTNVELCRANERLEHLANMKDQFLANMSHELRTPLNAVLGLSEALMEDIYGPLTPKQRESLHIIQQSGQHLLDLINDILDLSKIQADRMSLDIIDVDLDSLSQQVMRLVRSQASTRRQRLHFSSDGAQGMIKGDPKRLKQIVLNLLSNAVKFTPEGGEVGIEIRYRDEDDKVCLTVWDTGIGIPVDQWDLIFEPFVQLDGDLARQHAGTGLGLSLVARLTEMHGGRMEIDSAPGRGSRFTVILPGPRSLHAVQTTVEIDRPAVANERLSMERMPVAGGKILIVEDNAANITHVRDYLQNRGFHVVTAGNGLDGIEAATQLLPDVVLMDIQMPGIDGLEAIARLRRDPRTEKLYIVALTALAMTEDRARCLEAGADAYLSKPFSLKELETLITQFTSNQGT